METSASSLRRIPHGSSALRSQRLCGSKVTARPQRVRVGGGGFVDDGHLRYYASMGKTKEEKKRRKLAENLSRDLSELIRTGFGLEDREGGHSERMSISEAAELMLAQLEQVRAKEKEMMIKSKKEGTSMMKKKDCDESSSSSSSESSESSDSDCEEEVDMSTFRTVDPVDVTPMTPATSTLVPKNVEQQMLEETLPKSIESSLSSTRGTGCTCTGIIKNTVASNTSLADTRMLPSQLPSPMLSAVAVTGDRIEVCMGGKCKRSGGLQYYLFAKGGLQLMEVW